MMQRFVFGAWAIVWTSFSVEGVCSLQYNDRLLRKHQIHAAMQAHRYRSFDSG